MCINLLFVAQYFPPFLVCKPYSANIDSHTPLVGHGNGIPGFEAIYLGTNKIRVFAKSLFL